MPLDPDIVLVPSSLDDVADALADRVLARFRGEYAEVARRARLGRYMNDEQTTQETGLTKRQLRHLRSQNRIEYVKRGRLILNVTASVFDYLDAGRVPSRGD